MGEVIVTEEANQWLEKFNKHVKDKAYDDAIKHLANNYETAFTTSSLHKMYNIASTIPDKYYKSSLSKVLLGWLCFVCGDNKKVNWVITSTKESELETADEKSNYYALVSMIKCFESKEEGLKYAKLAIDVLAKEGNSFTIGNAYLTYARQLTNNRRYREGAKYFEKAYNVFQKTDSTFLAIICFVNECLNLYFLGQCKRVIEKCQKILMMNSSKNREIEDYMNIIKLPMGMCYYQMNKRAIAIKALSQAKTGIDNLKLVHMHGLVEQYLFQCHRLMNEKDKMKDIIKGLQLVFENLHYPEIKYLIICMKIKSMLDLNQEPKEEWIEELELAYQLNSQQTPAFIFEVLTELMIKGYSDIITEDLLIKRLEKSRYEGHIPQIQSISLYLGELFYKNNDIDTMRIHLKSACDIYNQHGLFVKFINQKLECFKYLKELDTTVVEQIKKSGIDIDMGRSQQMIKSYNLTNREIDVLKLICKGKSNKEIAKILFISVGTTKWHISNIFSKLEVKKRFKAIEKAKQLNLINS